MRHLKDKIFIFDLHNTLYDEVLEYGSALSAAIDYFFAQARQQGMPLNEDLFHQQLAAAHAKLGSDWDNDVWGQIPQLQKLAAFDELKKQAVSLRQSTSEELTRRYAYTDTLDAVRVLQKPGARIYLVTEATANAAADALRWLDLDGVFETVYSWPFAKPYQPLEKTRQCFFPPHPAHKDRYLQKPHPYILATVILDIAKGDDRIPEGVRISDVFESIIDDTIDVSPLLYRITDAENNVQAIDTVKAIATHIEIKDTPYKNILQKLRDQCFYIGDSFFKDGFLARNTGLPFVHAGYGKKIADEKAFEQAQEVLYKVTGWEPVLLQLTQEAAKLPGLTNEIKPYFTCRESFRDFLDFLGDRNVLIRNR